MGGGIGSSASATSPRHPVRPQRRDRSWESRRLSHRLLPRKVWADLPGGAETQSRRLQTHRRRQPPRARAPATCPLRTPGTNMVTAFVLPFDVRPAEDRHAST